MKKEWFAAKELIGITGLPSSPQGINLMAKREGWQQCRRLGVQGKAIEYHIDSLLGRIPSLLRLKENSAEYEVQKKDPLAVWIGAFNQLTDAERERVTNFILREGIEKLIEFVHR